MSIADLCFFCKRHASGEQITIGLMGERRCDWCSSKSQLYRHSYPDEAIEAADAQRVHAIRKGPPPRPGLYDAGSLGDFTREEVTELWTDQLCTVCKHAPCPCCGDWCDTFVYTDKDGRVLSDVEFNERAIDGGDARAGLDSHTCCDMQCTYKAPPQFFTSDGQLWEP